MPRLHNRLAQSRQQRRWSQAELARTSGVSRAEVSAIETGRLVPSTEAALRLAKALGIGVEALFSLVPIAAEMDWAWTARAGDVRVWHASVGGRRLLFPVEATALGTLRHDVRVVAGQLESVRGAVPAERTLVIAGCDPSVGLLATEVAARSSFRVVPLTRSSGEALDLLARGLVHVAGLHLADEKGRSANAATVRHRLGAGYRLLHLVRWEEGVAVAPGRGRSIGALLAGHTRWVNREEGSGARRCLDRLLGPTGRRPRGYDHVVRDHRALAATITSGWAEAGICLRPVAAEAGLDFIPVQREIYDLCIADALLDDPRIAALLTAVRSRSYRHVLGDVPGWDVTQTGDLRSAA